MLIYFRLSLLSSWLLVLILTACTPTAEPIPPPTSTIPPTAVVNQPTPVPLTPEYSLETDQSDLTRVDEQGAIVVSVTPLNLGQPADSLNFDVSLDTHSVDLSMDLAVLSALTTDNGKSVAPIIWDAPLGGHHVSGTLSFPVFSEGTSILDGARTLTLTMKDVAAPERTFIWKLTGTN